MNQLPQDIVFQILSLVPFESLVKLRGVSKSWLQIATHLIETSHPQIVTGFFYPTGRAKALHYAVKHTNANANANASLQQSTDLDHNLSFLSPYNDFSLIHSCNGLVLCSPNRYMTQSIHTLRVYIVCNPALKSWTVLPMPTQGSQPFLLDFDPWSTPHYRVISVDRGRNYECSMYSSETGEWRQTNKFRSALTAMYLKQLVACWKGAAYAITMGSESTCWLMKDYVALTRLPEEAHKLCLRETCLGRFRGLGLRLGYLDDELQLAVWSHRGEGTDQWVMEYRSNWASFPPRRRRCNRRRRRPRVVALHPFANLVYIRGDRILYQYDFGRMVLEEYCRLESEATEVVYPFSPCLHDVIDVPNRWRPDLPILD